MGSGGGEMRNAASMKNWDETELHFAMWVVTYIHHLERRMY